jgi:hypothetical protein
MIITNIRHDDVLPDLLRSVILLLNFSLDEILWRGRNQFIWRLCQCIKTMQRLMRGRSVNNELRKLWKEESWPKLKYYTGIFLNGPRKRTRNFDWDCQSVDTVAQTKEWTWLLQLTIMNQFHPHRSSQQISVTFNLMLYLTPFARSYAQTFPRSFPQKLLIKPLIPQT